jgi:hypothetical protein
MYHTWVPIKNIYFLSVFHKRSDYLLGHKMYFDMYDEKLITHIILN